MVADTIHFLVASCHIIHGFCCGVGLNFGSCCISRSVQMSLILLLVGVGIATVTDLQLNALGSVLSLLAIVTTCVAQIVSFCSLHFSPIFLLCKWPDSNLARLLFEMMVVQCCACC